MTLRCAFERRDRILKIGAPSSKVQREHGVGEAGRVGISRLSLLLLDIAPQHPDPSMQVGNESVEVEGRGCIEMGMWVHVIAPI